MKFRLCSTLVVAAVSIAALAEPIPIHHQQGAMRGFLLIRSQSGSLLGHGEYSELAVGERVTARLTLNFRDGSLDDEVAVFNQRSVFQFVSTHHVQRGPFFKNAIDEKIDANGQVTIQTTGSDGKVKTETNHFDLPPDLSNGLLCAMLLNIPHSGAGTSVGMILPTAKGRLVRLNITPDGTAPFYAVAGDRRTASIFRIHIDLGGIAGVVAPMIGKQPVDLKAWILEGEIPVLVRETGQLSEGGPVVSLELAGTTFTRAAATK